MGSLKTLQVNAYSDSLPNHPSPKLEITKMSFSQDTDEQIVVHSYNGTRLIEERSKLLTVTATWMTLEGMIPSEGSHSHKITYCTIIDDILERTKLEWLPKAQGWGTG